MSESFQLSMLCLFNWTEMKAANSPLTGFVLSVFKYYTRFLLEWLCDLNSDRQIQAMCLYEILDLVQQSCYQNPWNAVSSLLANFSFFSFCSFLKLNAGLLSSSPPSLWYWPSKAARSWWIFKVITFQQITRKCLGNCHFIVCQKILVWEHMNTTSHIQKVFAAMVL